MVEIEMKEWQLVTCITIINIWVLRCYYYCCVVGQMVVVVVVVVPTMRGVQHIHTHTMNHALTCHNVDARSIHVVMLEWRRPVKDVVKKHARRRERWCIDAYDTHRRVLCQITIQTHRNLSTNVCVRIRIIKLSALAVLARVRTMKWFLSFYTAIDNDDNVVADINSK